MKLALLLAFGLVATPRIGDDVVSAQVPGHWITVQLRAPGFVPAPESERGENGLIYGSSDNVWLQVSCIENFPYRTATEYLEPFSKGKPPFRGFSIPGFDVVDRSVDGELVWSDSFIACKATPEFLYVVEASRIGTNMRAFDDKLLRELERAPPMPGTRPKAKPKPKPKPVAKSKPLPRYRSSQFQALLKSLRVEGEFNRNHTPHPPAVLDVRDAAAAVGATQMAWVEQRCKEAADDYAPHYYLGTLAFVRKDYARALAPLERASDLLFARETMTRRESFALFKALAFQVPIHVDAKRFDLALARARELIAAAERDQTDPRDAETVVPIARFQLAGCFVQVGDTAAALRELESLLRTHPEFRARAQTDPLFEPVRASPDFRALIERE